MVDRFLPHTAAPPAPGRSRWQRRGLALLLDFGRLSHRHAAGLLIVLSLAMFLPGFFSLPPVDRDEARFAQASKQMVESGDYVDIRFQDEVRYKKPVGIYWLQSAAVRAAEAVGVDEATTTIWLYRLPSLFGAIGGVLLTYWAGLAFVSRRAALLAAAMMASCILLGVEARLAKTDAMLFLTTTAAIGALARAYLWPRRQPPKTVGWPVAFIFWTALAAGTLLKGPLIFLFVGFPALIVSVLDRNARWLTALRPLPGIVWFLLLASPWFILIMTKSGSAFLQGSIGADALPKILGSQEGHGAPPGFYFLLFWATFWPGAVVAGLATPTVWRARREPGAKFLLAWLIPSWIVFELVVTKLPHYVLPLYPAIAILIAGVLERGALSKSRWLMHGTVGWVLMPAAVAIASVAGFIVLAHELGFLVWPFAAGALVMGLFAWWLYDVDGAEYAMLRAIIAAFLVAVTLFGIVLSSLPGLFPSVTMAQVLHDSDCEAPEAAAVGYHEPSLVFLAGTRTLLTDGAGAADFLRQGPCRYAFIEQRHERGFVQRAEALGLRYRQVTKIDGFNISNGRRVSMSVFRSSGQP
jgi:4-amino-4-deoxy-L-arabinose transferase-like glycosyltransferase